MATSEDVKVLVVESAPETPRTSSTPQTPASQVSPKSKRVVSQFMPRRDMSPREVAFWPPQRYESGKVDFSKPPQDWDTPLLLRQVVEHQRPFPLDSVTFREYLVGYYSEENIDFLLELSRIRRKILEDNKPRVDELIQFYEKYMKPSGSKSANISAAALSHVEGIIESGEDLNIADFHLANRDIADLLIRGPYLKDFFRKNLETGNVREIIPDRIILVFFTAWAAGSYAITVLYSYYFVILGWVAFCFLLFMFQKWMIQICPILTMLHGGYRLGPNASFYHCLWINEYLQRVHDPDILEAQMKSCKAQMVSVTVLPIVVSVGVVLLRYYLIEN